MKAKILTGFLVLFFSYTSLSQTSPAISASVNKSKILIGEPIELVVEYEFTTGKKPSFALPDSIPHFEFIQPAKTDSIESGNSTRVRNLFFITSFDSGKWVIPSFQLSRQVKTEEIPVEVIFSEFNPEQDYHDIKDIIEATIPKKKFEWWWIAAGAVMVAAAAYYFFQKRKPGKPGVPGNSLNAFDEAMAGLNRLKQEKLPGKVYYSMLVEIFRVYVYKRKNIRSQQKTTNDLIVQISELGLSRDQFDAVSQALRMADFVKFAKYQPAIEDDELAFVSISQSIKAIEQSILQKPPTEV